VKCSSVLVLKKYFIFSSLKFDFKIYFSLFYFNYFYSCCVFVNSNTEFNANNTAVMQMLSTWCLCFDNWAELIKSLKTHTPQQSVTNNSHNITVSLSRDNVSINMQKCTDIQQFSHAISKSHRLKRCARRSLIYGLK